MDPDKLFNLPLHISSDNIEQNNFFLLSSKQQYKKGKVHPCHMEDKNSSFIRGSPPTGAHFGPKKVIC